MRKLLLALVALTAPAMAQPAETITVTAPTPLNYSVSAFPETGTCMLLFDQQGTKRVWMEGNFDRGSLVVAIDDKTLGLKALGQYDVKLKRGDVDILEYGLAMHDRDNFMSRTAGGLGTQVYIDPLKEIANAKGDFTYSIVVHGKDVELFRIPDAVFEKSVNEVLECAYGVAEGEGLNITNIEPVYVPTPTELGIGDGTRAKQPE
jgi:hypothetical protein